MLPLHSVHLTSDVDVKVFGRLPLAPLDPQFFGHHAWVGANWAVVTAWLTHSPINWIRLPVCGGEHLGFHDFHGPYRARIIDVVVAPETWVTCLLLIHLRCFLVGRVRIFLIPIVPIPFRRLDGRGSIVLPLHILGVTSVLAGVECHFPLLISRTLATSLPLGDVFLNIHIEQFLLAAGNGHVRGSNGQLASHGLPAIVRIPSPRIHGIHD